MGDLLLLSVFIVSTILNIGLAFYGWRRRRLQGAMAFSVAMVLFAVLPLTQVVNATSSELAVKIMALKSRVETTGIGATLWLIMMMQLTGYSRLIKWRLLLALLVVPLAILFLNWTENPLFRSDYYIDSSGMLRWSTGPVFWLGFAYLNIIFLAPLFFLWRSYSNVSPLSLKQTLALSLSVILPILVNALSQLNAMPEPGKSFPFAAGPLMGLIVAGAVFQYRLFDVIPIARGLLIESMSDGVLVLDTHSRIVDVNPAMQQMLNLNLEEILGKNIEAVLATRPESLSRLRNVSNEQTELFIDGDPPHYMDVRISPLSNQRGQLAGRLVVVRDITRRRQAETELQLQSAALNAAANAIMITDNHNVIQWVNPAFTHLTGYSESEAVGKTPLILRSNKHSAEFYKSMHETAYAGKVWKGEVINRRRDGTEYVEEQTITPVSDRDGRISHFIAIKHDITERKQAEDKLLEKETQMRALNDNLPNGYTYQLDIGVQGETRRFIYISAGVEKIFGITIQQILDDPTCLSKRFLEEDNIKIAEIETSAFAAMTTFKAEARFMRENNRVGWMLLTSTPRKLANDHTVWDGLALDITEHKRAESELQTALARTRVLHDVASTAITSESLPFLLQEIVQYVAQGLPANRISLITLDLPSKKIKSFARGGPGADQVLLSVTFDELMEGLSGWAIRTGKSALSPKGMPDSRESEAVRKRRKETNCGSILVTPLQYQNTALGTLTLINLPDEPDFTEKDVEFVEAVASQVSSIIVKVELEENLQQQNRYLATLHQIALDLLNKREIADLLQTIVDQASMFLDAPFCELMLHEGDELVVKAYTDNQPFLAGDRVGRGEAHLSWQAFDTCLPARVNDYSKWPQHRKIYDEVDIHAVVVLPILSGGKSIGVLDISRSEPGHNFDDFEIQAATLFAKLAALALENAQLHEALRQESIRDPLTGLFNRRFMEETLSKELFRAERKSLPLTLVVLDLDHLKEINDTLGHSAGDDVIIQLGLRIKACIRAGDVACRYGGDEFILILSDTKLDSARQRMEELRKNLKLLSIQHEGESISPLTLSIGVAEYPKHGKTGRELLKAADRALYQAKQTGRDKVMTA